MFGHKDIRVVIDKSQVSDGAAGPDQGGNLMNSGVGRPLVGRARI
jgi:hypothetical protein